MSDFYLDHYLFDNSKVYLQGDEKPPKGVRLHKGIRKATARWYESQGYKENMGKNKLSRLLLKAMRKLKGKYAQPGTHERKSVQDVLKKIYGTYSIMQFVEDLNLEHYPEFSNYNLTSYSEGDALKRLLPGMVSEIRSDEPLHAPLQYRDSTYDEVRALTKIKPGETFISKKWLPLYEDKEKARNATMNIYSDDEVKKIIFRVDASTGMGGVSHEDLLIGKENQPFEVTDIQDEEGIRTISVKPLSNEQYGERGVLPLGLPRSYYDQKALALQENHGLNNIVKSLDGKPSLVFEDSDVELESIFGEYKGDYHILSDKLQKIQQHQSHQAHNGNWFGDKALEGMGLLKMACDAAPPLDDLTVYIPFDAVQAYKRPQSEEENSQVRERVEIVENLNVGDTFKIRMNMAGSLSPDVANSRSTYQYTDNRESKYGMITYRYKPHGDPEFDKGVVTSEGSVILQRNLNWKVVGIHDVGKGDMSHKVIDIEPVAGDETPHYPGGEVQYTTIEPKEFDPGAEGGSDGSFTTSLIEKYDEIGINAMDFSGDHHPDYDGNTLEGQAMASWCSGDYEEIGTFIRTGKMLRDQLSYPTKDGMDKFTPETILPYLDRYIETFPPMPEGLILYRGVGGNTASRMIKGLKVGDTCVDPCYMSFTDNPEVAWKFARKPNKTCDDDPKVFFRLVSKGGEHAALGNFSESEIVFGRNQKLKIVNISKANFDTLSPDRGGNQQVYETPVIVYDVECINF